jgi:lipoate synthase
LNFSNTHHSYLSVLKVADRQDLSDNTHHSYLGVLKVADRQDLPDNTHHSYLGVLKVADRQLLPAIKIEALAPGIMHIVYCFFSNIRLRFK